MSFVKKLTAAGDQSTQASTVLGLQSISIVTVPDGADTYAQAIVQSAYPLVSINGIGRDGSMVNICSNANLLDLMETDAQDSGPMLWNSGVRGTINISKTPGGVDFTNFQLTFSAWPAAATGAVREVDVYYTAMNQPAPENSEYYMYYGNDNAATSFSLGGDNQEIFADATKFVSFSTQTGTVTKAEAEVLAGSQNGVVFADALGTAANGPRFGYLNLLPMLPDELPGIINFTPNGEYLIRETKVSGPKKA